MFRTYAFFALALYATTLQSDDTKAIVICSCGEPAFIIYKEEQLKWSIFGYDSSEFENEHNLILRWMCSQKLKSINNFQILKTENYVGHKCPIQV